MTLVAPRQLIRKKPALNKYIEGKPSPLTALLKKALHPFFLSGSTDPHTYSSNDSTGVISPEVSHRAYLIEEYEGAQTTHQEVIRCISAVIMSYIDSNSNVDHDKYAVFRDSRNLFTSLIRPSLSLASVQEFINEFYIKAQLEFESLIVTLIYIDRLQLGTYGELCVMHHNWQSILFAAMHVSAQMWDDFAMINVDIASIYSQFPLKRVNELEVAFLCAINYHLNIDAVEYAKYFYHIRKVQKKASVVTAMPTLSAKSTSIKSDASESIKPQRSPGRLTLLAEKALAMLLTPHKSRSEKVYVEHDVENIVNIEY